MPYDVTAELDGPARGRLYAAPFVELCERTLAGEGVEDCAVGLLFAGDELLWRLNREHRGFDQPTDVLSFPAGEEEPPTTAEEAPSYLGDIAISVDAARRQAADAGLTLDEELRHLVLHGLLHLLGYDHETDEAGAAMSEREEAVLGSRIHATRGHEERD